MDPLLQAQKLYLENGDPDGLYRDLVRFLDSPDGWVIKTPTCLALLEIKNRGRLGLGWSVWLAVGTIPELRKNLPFRLPWIEWGRRGKPAKWHRLR